MAQPEDGRPAEPVPPSKRRRLFASRADVTLFIRTLARRFLNDLCLERAAALSYTAVVSLVPAAAVSLAFLSSLPQSDTLRSDVEDLLTLYLLPNAGEAAVQAFRTFIAKAAGLSALGFLGLALTAIMLLITVNTAFDTIWRVTRPRPLLIRLLAYGAILTVGPILMGVALSISGLLLATGERVCRRGLHLVHGLDHTVRAAPAGGGGLHPALLCRAELPGGLCATRWRAARPRRCCSRAPSMASRSISCGFPTYNAIYGALAAIPVLLAWIYLCWIATLVGAELAAALPEWRSRPAGDTDRQEAIPVA